MHYVILFLDGPYSDVEGMLCSVVTRPLTPHHFLVRATLVSVVFSESILDASADVFHCGCRWYFNYSIL